MNKNVLRLILRHMFAAFASAALAFTVILTVLRIAFDVGILKTLPYKSGLYENTYAELVDDLKKLSPASGVSEEFFATAVDKQLVAERMEHFYISALSGEMQSDVKVEHERVFQEEIYSKLCAYAENEGYTLTDSIKDELMHLSAICSQRCSARTANTILGRLMSIIGSLFNRLSLPCIVLIIIMAAFTVFCLFFALRLGSSLEIPLCTSGLLLIIIPTYVYMKDILSRVGIGLYSMHSFFIAFANNIFIPMLFLGIMFIVSSLIIFVVKRWLES